MGFWERVKKDVPKSFKEGVDVIRLKAEQLTSEGKKQIQLFDLKNKVHKEMADLGGAVYSSGKPNPKDDAKVKKILDKIKKLESQISKLEKAKRPSKKKAAKKKAAKKKAAKKKTAKKKPAKKKA
jgi:topoisomerase IA-like protein